MLRNPQISWNALAIFSRSMAQMLEAGVDVRKSLVTSAAKSSDSRLGTTVGDVSRRIARGATLADALSAHSDRFPTLFRDLVDVGEKTGAVPEVFSALSRYYESRLKQIRDFRSAIAWPVIQLFMAVMIIGLLIYILGILPKKGDAPAIDILGLGLVGPAGATFWFLSCFGLTAAGYILWKLTVRSPSMQMAFHPFLMRIPVIGRCMSDFAISRFSWCFALTQQAGMSIQPSLECSLKATANGAFVTAAPRIWQELNDGETFADALSAAQLFPTDYLQFVETAEQTGTVPEQLDRMSKIFEENAQRSLQRLASIGSGLVWLFVAGIIIYFIFRIVMLVYINPLNDAVRDAMQ
jgi:type IV pilus assembly protein PilC